MVTDEMWLQIDGGLCLLGSVEIGANKLRSLSGLENLVSVGGRLAIFYEQVMQECLDFLTLN